MNNLNSILKTAVCLFTFALCTSVNAANVVLDFEGVGDLSGIGGFYNGGFSGAGRSGTNYGIAFSSSATGVVDLDKGGSGNFANVPSGSSALIFLTGSTAGMNVASGFKNGFSFLYSYKSNDPAPISIYSGFNGSGTLLASMNMKKNYNLSCSGDPFGDSCHWDALGVKFQGVAKSVVFGGPAEFAFYDNVTLGNDVPGVVPTPGALLLFGSGLFALLGFKRKA